MQTNGKSKQKKSRFSLFFIAIGNWFVDGFKAIGAFFASIGLAIGRFFKNMYKQFVTGGWRTKISHFFMGVGHILLVRPIKGLIYLFLQIGYFIFMFIPGGGLHWLGKLTNLGTVAFVEEQVCTQIPRVPLEDCDPGMISTRPVYVDNSMLIMLFGVATLLVTFAFLTLYFVQVKGVYEAEKIYVEAKAIHKESGSDEKFVNTLPKFKDEVKSLLNARFHFTTMTIPAITITTFTILPLVFMILLAFTNYNKDFSPPNKLFSWVGLQTFQNLFSGQGTSSFGQALGKIVQWTFIWAFFATFSNYILGMILSMIINRRSIKAKKVWRTVFVISIAVPQFVTLLLMNQLLKDNGPLNHTLMSWGWIETPIKFLTDPTLAKVTVIMVNIWVGVPYTMLITSGILMNIPADLYESARIDGAGPVRQFMKITLPYMLFVTGPYLITQFIGNINNFNVIFFLTQGGPPTGHLGQATYGHTDILVTWLYALTVGGDKQEYAIGSALGIFIFLISATITLVLYSRTAAASQEGDFA